MHLGTKLVLMSTPAGRNLLAALGLLRGGMLLAKRKFEADRIAGAQPWQKLMQDIAAGKFTTRRRP